VIHAKFQTELVVVQLKIVLVLILMEILKKDQIKINVMTGFVILLILTTQIDMEELLFQSEDVNSLVELVQTTTAQTTLVFLPVAFAIV
jgi:hypothetical protein